MISKELNDLGMNIFLVIFILGVPLMCLIQYFLRKKPKGHGYTVGDTVCGEFEDEKGDMVYFGGKIMSVTEKTFTFNNLSQRKKKDKNMRVIGSMVVCGFISYGLVGGDMWRLVCLDCGFMMILAYLDIYGYWKKR